MNTVIVISQNRLPHNHIYGRAVEETVSFFPTTFKKYTNGNVEWHRVIGVEVRDEAILMFVS